MGDDASHWEGVGRISPQGGLQSDGEATSAREGRSVGIPPSRERNGGGGNAVFGDLRILPPEHGRTVYCGQAHYVPVSGSGAESGAKGVLEVVGTGRGGYEGGANGSSGGGTDGGGGGYGRNRDGDRLSWGRVM